MSANCRATTNPPFLPQA
uniref:Uncharacterized protein n=1 Tax=Rhizophora mucronata TaxID=61149 RepID=A0A2P2QZ80_RHIMU